MLDRFILKYLTKRGKIAYFVGQLILLAIWAYYVFGIVGYSVDQGEPTFFMGMIIIFVLWVGLCLLFWKKPKEDENANSPG